MQRSKVGERTGLLQHLRGDEHTMAEKLSAVGKAVTHSRHLLNGTNHTRHGVQQCIHYHLQTLGM